MIHELLTITNNRVNIPGVKLEENEVVVSQHDDEFFQKIMFKNFGEVAEEIQKHV
jgi:vacuolar protein sorting-associated protein 45